ncbi:hypothetical protein [Terriglobus albidus]|uniref:hypothetical protein n=1 Tax=Terriglobus albidus TaxID=1592106 RepID=UPI0021DFC76E|nr:hypothetical protein [Terriglobus albidus]
MRLRNVLVASAITAGSMVGFAQTVTGSGSAGKLPVFTTTGSTIGDSVIYQATNGNVGIGTTSPDAPLKVNTSAGTTKIFGPNLELNNFGAEYNLSVTSGNFNIQNNSDGGAPVRFAILGGSGNVGLGTSSPQQNLSVQGGAVIDQGNANAGAFDNSGLHFGSSSGEGIASSRSGTNNTWGLDFYTNFQKRLSITNVGSVGIGTSNPLGSFEISAPVGGFVVSGLNLDPQWNSLNLSRVVNSGKLVTGWNRMGGDGEADFLANRGGGGTGGFAFYDVTNGGSVNPLLRLHGNGNVGIGTIQPSAKLEVNGSIKLTSGSGASMTYPDGTVQSTAWNGTTCGGDYAESVDVTGDRKRYEAGDVLVIDADTPDKFLHSSEPYSRFVAGIYSTRPGLTGRREGRAKTGEEVPMAMLGIVPTKVSAENGVIRPGDLLVSSATEGYAMKGTDSTRMMGAVIGKAMGRLDKGTGTIEVLVSLQ